MNCECGIHRKKNRKKGAEVDDDDDDGGDDLMMEKRKQRAPAGAESLRIRLVISTQFSSFSYGFFLYRSFLSFDVVARTLLTLELNGSGARYE